MPFRSGQSGNPAGRRPGLQERRPRRTAARKMAAAAAETGLTPLEIMLTAMRELWAAGDKLGACAVAKDAAPYMHPRLSSVALDANVTRDPIHLTHEELLAIAAGGRTDGAGADPGEDEPDQLH
jgi:hypothetical protein